jgi:hypothetical protein
MQQEIETDGKNDCLKNKGMPIYRDENHRE